jgi:hypothetical protein
MASSDFSKKELRNLAKQRRVRGYKHLTKNQLLKVLQVESAGGLINPVPLSEPSVVEKVIVDAITDAIAEPEVSEIPIATWELVPVSEPAEPTQTGFVLWIGDLDARRIECYQRPISDMISNSHWIFSWVGGKTQYFQDNGTFVPLKQSLSREQQLYPAFTRSRSGESFVLKPYQSLDEMKKFMQSFGDS